MEWAAVQTAITGDEATSGLDVLGKVYVFNIILNSTHTGSGGHTIELRKRSDTSQIITRFLAPARSCFHFDIPFYADDGINVLVSNLGAATANQISILFLHSQEGQ